MNHRGWLTAYVAAVIVTTLVHQPAWLAVGLGGALLVTGPGRWRLLRRALISVLVFNLTVSIGYLVMASWRGEFRADYLLLINLRVLLLVYLGFWIVGRINISKALSFSPTLAFLATLAAGQIQGFREVLTDFNQAFRSRNPTHPHLAERMRLATAQGQHLLDKSVHASTEIGQAMRSRGCFDD